MKFVDLTGVRFTHLIALELTRKRTATGNAYHDWLCVCDCGFKKLCRGYHLRNGKNKTCGRAVCPYAASLRECRTLPKHGGAKNRRYAQYRIRAKRKGHAFELTKEEFHALVTAACYYCGNAPTIMHGVDRADSGRGYVSGNSRPCCWLCNNMKGVLNEADFLSHMTKILTHRRTAAC